MMTLILSGVGVAVLCGGYLYLRLRQSQKQAQRLQQEKAQLQTEKP